MDVGSKIKILNKALGRKGRFLRDSYNYSGMEMLLKFEFPRRLVLNYV